MKLTKNNSQENTNTDYMCKKYDNYGMKINDFTAV